MDPDVPLPPRAAGEGSIVSRPARGGGCRCCCCTAAAAGGVRSDPANPEATRDAMDEWDVAIFLVEFERTRYIAVLVFVAFVVVVLWFPLSRAEGEAPRRQFRCVVVAFGETLEGRSGPYCHSCHDECV